MSAHAKALNHPVAVQLEEVVFRWPKGRGQGADSADSGFCLQLPACALARGESLFISGPSGCGKSTLLNLVGGVLLAQQGQVRVLGQDLADLSASGRDAFRGDHLGFIFQQFNLVPYLSVLDNVLLPCRFSALRRHRCGGMQEARETAERLLLALDLRPGLWRQDSSALSVGQQQRVAAARALIGAPELIVADEPTSALDPQRAAAFLALLRAECAKVGSSLLLVSHDHRLAAGFAATLTLAEPAGIAGSAKSTQSMVCRGIA